MAVKAPKVQTLAQSMASLEPGYSEQRGLIKEQIEGLGARSQVSRDRLEGAKVNAFNTINDQALGRGVGAAFSGIPLHEQTDYLAGTYLPGMQDIELKESDERMQLRGTLADLNMQQRTTALSRVDQQQQALNQWNLQQAQIEAQRREAELNRKFQTSERIASQQFTAAQNAANRAASAAAAASSGGSGPDLYADISGVFRETAGSDRYVSPTNYAQQKAFAARYGMSGKEFDANFKTFRNPKDTGYKLG